MGLAHRGSRQAACPPAESARISDRRTRSTPASVQTIERTKSSSFQPDARDVMGEAGHPASARSLGSQMIPQSCSWEVDSASVLAHEERTGRVARVG